MKILILVACLGPLASVLAQNTVPPVAPQIPRTRILNQNQNTEVKAAFPENYLVTISVTENEKPLTELAIATARAEFRAESLDPSITFLGTLTPQEDGTVMLGYSLGAEVAVPVSTTQSINPQGEAVKSTSVSYKTQSAQSQVLLRLGEPLNVLRSGNRTYRLTVSKLPEPSAKTPQAR